METEKVLIIAGPTSSGKTTLAFCLGAQEQTSIISADSRQVYQGLGILTGKDIPEDFVEKDSGLIFNSHPVVFYETGNLRLWGFDLLRPDEVFNAADFSFLTRKIIAKEQQENRKIIIVGGTGFYLKSLTEPDSLAQVVPNDSLRLSLEKATIEDLQQKLWEINPQKFVSMNQSDASNPRRLVRAIEVASLPSRTTQKKSVDKPLSTTWIGIKTSLSDLKTKVEKRVRDRLYRGAVTEVESLLRNYSDQNLPVYTTLGVKPIIRFLSKEIDLDTLIETWVTDEVNYAKRQLTWFKKQRQIVWYDLDRITKQKIV